LTIADDYQHCSFDNQSKSSYQFFDLLSQKQNLRAIKREKAFELYRQKFIDYFDEYVSELSNYRLAPIVPS
jgi:hypothetical protein